MIIKDLFKVIVALTICNFSFAQDMGMGGPPPKKKEMKRNEVSPNKEKYSGVQKKYQDQIVFSNNKISKTEADPSSFIATWDMTQPLFYRVFRTNTIAEGVYDYMKSVGKKYDKYYYADFATLTVVSINGKELATRESIFGDESQVNEWVTNSGFVYNPEKPKKSSKDIGKGIKRAFHALGDDYKDGALLDMKIEIYAVNSELDDPRVKRPNSDRKSLLSTGKLKVKVTREGMKKFAPTMCYGILKNGSSMVDLELESKTMVKFSETYGKATDANITSEDWKIVKNGLGIPIQRNLSTKVTYYDNTNTHSIIDYYINQAYNVNGYQKSINTSSVGQSWPYSPYCILYKQEIVK